MRHLADVDGRIVLTRDRELLKCREIRRGCWRNTPGRSRCASAAMFAHCKGCDRVYWPGSHYQRMRAAIDRLSSGHDVSC